MNEAMASGLPALVSEDVGCAPDLVAVVAPGLGVIVRYPAADAFDAGAWW